MPISPSKFPRLFDRRLRWGLTPKGWLLVLLLLLAVPAIIFASIYPFLSTTRRLHTEFLVVEGWIPPVTIRAAAREISSFQYQQVFVTGGPVAGSGPYSNDFNTSASVGYTRLISAGVPIEKLHKVPSRVRDRDRTYSAALALKQYLSRENIHPGKINIVTESVHGRRTRLLFQKALGPEIKVGIISIPPEEYPAHRWWKYSAGVKEVISETAAYLYVRTFFWP